MASPTASLPLPLCSCYSSICQSSAHDPWLDRGRRRRSGWTRRNGKEGSERAQRSRCQLAAVWPLPNERFRLQWLRPRRWPLGDTLALWVAFDVVCCAVLCSGLVWPPAWRVGSTAKLAHAVVNLIGHHHPLCGFLWLRRRRRRRQRRR